MTRLAVLLLPMCLAAPVWVPYVHPRLDVRPYDDAENHLVRLFAFEHVLAQGVLFPPWLPALFHGFGQPLPSYYAPLSYLVMSWIHWFGHVDLYGSYQATAAVAVCLGATGAALLVWQVTSDVPAALCGAVFYVFGPYPFLTNLYARGDVPEAFALGLLPWVVAGFVGAAGGRRTSLAWGLLAVVAGSAAVLVHNMLGPADIGVALGIATVTRASTAWSLFERERRADFAGDVAPRNARAALAAIASALLPPLLLAGAVIGLTAYFWLPMVQALSLVRLADVLIQEHEHYAAWLVNPIGATPLTQSRGPIDLQPTFHYGSWAPQKISWAQLLPLLLLAVPLRRANRARRARSIATHCDGGKSAGVGSVGIGCGVIAVVSWFLTTIWSRPLWDHSKLLQGIQLTYRLLGPCGFGLAVVAALAIYRLRVRPGLQALAALTTCAALATNALGSRDVPIKPVVNRTVDAAMLRSYDRLAGYMGTTAREEFMPRTVRVAVYSPTDLRAHLFDTLYPESGWIAAAVMPYSGAISVESLAVGGLELRARIVVDAAGGTLAIHQLAFPGWTAYIDGVAVPARPMPFRDDVQATLGFLLVDVPPGEHNLAVSFESTAPRLAGLATSGLTLCLILSSASWLIRRQGGDIAARAGALLFAAGAVAALVATLWHLDRQWARFTQLGPPHVPLQTALVANLASLTAHGQARIDSPSGAQLGPDRFVDLRWLALGPLDADGAHGGSLRRFLYLHPPSRVSFVVDIPPGAVFQAGLALDPRTWDQETGDGVRFVVEAQVEHQSVSGASPSVLLDRRVNPRARTEERGWNDVTVDLADYAGKRVVLSLRTDPVEDLNYDWAGWGNPVVVVRRSARWATEAQ